MFNKWVLLSLLFLLLLLLYYCVLSLWIEPNFMPLSPELPAAPATGVSPGPLSPTLRSLQAGTPPPPGLLGSPGRLCVVCRLQYSLIKTNQLAEAAWLGCCWEGSVARRRPPCPAPGAKPHPSPPPTGSPDSGVLGRQGRAPSFQPHHNTQDLISVCQKRRPRLGEPIWPPEVPQPRKGGTKGESQVLRLHPGRVRTRSLSSRPARALC